MKSSLTPYNMCLNKVPYSSKKSALEERNWLVVRAAEEWGTKAENLPEPYKCSFCSKWHLGKSKRKRK